MTSMKNPNMINNAERDLIEKQLKKLSYPFTQADEEFIYETMLSRVNMDKRREEIISTGRGFIISRPQKTTKRDLKDPNSIYSTKFGQTLQDVNALANRYRCKCGNLESHININVECPICGEKVRYVDDDFSYTGWIVLQDKYHIIHPNMYKSLEFYIGKDLVEILEYSDIKDIDGHIVEREVDPEKPFKGIGLIQFKERFDEIMAFYRKKNLAKGKKEDYYEDIMKHREIIFTQSICVFTTLLRPFSVSGRGFTFEGCNALYNMMARLASLINNNKLKINRKAKQKNQLLWDLQQKQQELYTEIEKILSGKKGVIRGLFGGRYQFTSRCVIRSDKTLRIDEVSLPYFALVELLQQQIINILGKVYNLSPNDAYNIWYAAQAEIDPRIVSIIQNLIDHGIEVTNPDGSVTRRKGLPVIINRNPTISFGSLLQVFVVKINFEYTMGTSLNILPSMEADYDGD